MRSSIPQVPIGELVTKVPKWEPLKSASTEPFIYIDISSINQESKKVSDIRRILPCDAPSRARQLVQTEDVLVSTVRPNLNAVAYIPALFNGATASTGFAVLRCIPEKLDGKYLYYWVRTPGFITEMTMRAIGASYPAVTEKIVLDSRIPLPLINKQRYIATILEKAESAREKRREANRLTDEFLKSTFLEMFGDPIKNSKGWEMKKLSELGKVITGSTPLKKKKSHYSQRDFNFFKPDDFKEYVSILSDSNDFLSEEGARIGRKAPSDTVLITCIGIIGKVGILLHESCFNQQINGIIPRKELIEPIFLAYLLKALQPVFERKSNAPVVPILNKTQFSSVKVPVAPIVEQSKFANLVKKVEKLKEKQHESEKELDNLFNSLMQKAFRGELFS